MQKTESKIKKLVSDKEFLKIKKLVIKRYPGAHTRLIGDSYEVCTKDGMPIRRDDLYMPANKSVRDAWTNLAQSLWFDKMFTKSQRAFSDEKMWKRLEKIEDSETTKKSNDEDLY